MLSEAHSVQQGAGSVERVLRAFLTRCAVLRHLSRGLLPLVVILPAGVIAAARSFDGLYGQDAFLYFDYAVGPLRDSLLRWEPPPPLFWPPGYPILVLLASTIVGLIPLAGQLVSLACGGFVALAVA